MYMNREEKSKCIVEENTIIPPQESSHVQNVPKVAGRVFLPSQTRRHLVDTQVGISDAATVGGIGIDLSTEGLVGAVDEESNVGAVLVEDVT